MSVTYCDRRSHPFKAVPTQSWIYRPSRHGVFVPYREEETRRECADGLGSIICSLEYVSLSMVPASVEALTRYRMPLSSTKELGKHTLHYCKDANLSCRMWRSVQSPPLLYATFGSITVKSCRRRRLILGGTVRQPQNCIVLRNPWAASGFPPTSLEIKFEAKGPLQGTHPKSR